ncbi:hypothetical protein MPSEU_000092100 [Mayamaea pseudoterrestris]|nr:hypothetical protein MPSEU_000092100 [Mayamaea pseudoterrestris]
MIDRRRFSLLQMCLFMLISAPYNQLSTVDAAASVPDLLERCTMIDHCRTCTDTDKLSMEECIETGKVQTLQCPVLDEDGEETEEFQTKYVSCNRTKTDDEFLMVRFQVLCLLFGSLACLSSRKQKSASASLFDQRKMSSRMTEKQRRRTSELPNELEMPELVDREELAALTENDGLEVV